MLDELSKTKEINLETHDLLIYGGGGQSRKFYSDLRQNPDVEVLWTGWSGPKWTSFLSIIPGQAGLLRVKIQSAFKEVYYELAAFSVSDVILISKDLTVKIVQEASKKTWRANFHSTALQDESVFVLTSEADESIIENGQPSYLYDYTFGMKISEDLKRIVTRAA